MLNRGKPFNLIAAVGKTNNGIGIKGGLPWRYKEDMKHFYKITTTGKKPNTVIMGRKTWESIPEKHKPLVNRQNIIISRTIKPGWYNYINGKLQLHKILHNHKKYKTNFSDAVKVCSNINNALNQPSALANNTFVIGGSELYTEAIKYEYCDKLYITYVNDKNKQVEYDTFFPSIPKHFKLIDTREGSISDLSFNIYQNWLNLESQEYQYLQLLQKILISGFDRHDRTGTGTKSVFGEQLRFSLANDVIPLITTKKMYWKGIVEELLFFLKGEHDNKILQAKGVHIWDGNTSREYLDKYGKKHIETDDLGLAYGVQWRAAGAPLGTINTNYVGKGIDQLKEIIQLIKNDPHSRRIIINAWNVPQLSDMALVPCHMLYQFYVVNNKLNCMMTQRSADEFLGIPFNIASVALFTHIIAKTCSLEPGEIIISMGDAHIYNNHISQVEKQLKRRPLKFPTLEITRPLSSVEDIEKLEFKDLKIHNYHCYPGIKGTMAV